MSVVSKFNCMYCGRPIAINYSAAFPPKEQTNGDEVDPPVPGGYRGDQSPALTQSELETMARQHGADPDRVDYSGCSDYRPEDERFKEYEGVSMKFVQTGHGFAEPPDDSSPEIPSLFDIARDICKNWLTGRDLTYALRDIDERERRAAATETGQAIR